MDNTVIVAILALIGTLIGSLGGILAANKLTTYRIEQLEKKVEKHNSVVERMFKLEQIVADGNAEIAHLKHYHEP